jgi:hypothetical protein
MSSFEQPIPRGDNAPAPQGEGLSLLSLHTQQSSHNMHASEDQTSKSRRPDSGSAQRDSGSWTYLVNLTATMLPDNEGGSGYKYNQLKNLKDLTKNSNSEVIVQAYDDNTGLLQRYDISRGEIHLSKPVKSAGTLQDLQSLLDQAPEGGHLALINEAHGNGDMGFLGDAGKYSVSDFEQAVKNGLESSGHASLDLLSMDSCLMGNVQVLDRLSGLAKNVVASELEEFSSVALSETPPVTEYDMQPIDQYLSTMLQHPPQDDRDAANQMLAISSNICDSLVPKEEACGTPTMAIYNLEAASEADHALDKFGVELQLAIKDPNVKKTVDSLIGQLHDVSQVEDNLRDVGDFAEGVVNLINSGKIKDGNGSLKLAAQNVLTADNDLVQDFYVNPDSKIVKIFGLTQLHGLNTFLPGPDFDVRDAAVDIVGEKKASTLPLAELLNQEVQTSLPDAYSGGWASFVTALRSS